MDAPQEFWPALDRGLSDIVNTLDELEEYLSGNEIVFKYAKSMKHPGPARNYKKQDLNSRSSSNWGWLYACLLYTSPSPRD